MGEKAGKWEVPIPTVRQQSESEVFKVLKSGKTRRKGWKRMVTKVTFVGDNFTRKPPKFERFRPGDFPADCVHSVATRQVSSGWPQAQRDPRVLGGASGKRYERGKECHQA